MMHQPLLVLYRTKSKNKTLSNSLPGPVAAVSGIPDASGQNYVKRSTLSVLSRKRKIPRFTLTIETAHDNFVACNENKLCKLHSLNDKLEMYFSRTLKSLNFERKNSDKLLNFS